MKRLGQLSALLCGISLLLHVYALVLFLFVENPAKPPQILSVLHVGVFICYFPPFWSRWRRLRELHDSGRPAGTAADGEFLLRGVKLPFKRLLKVYVVLVIASMLLVSKPTIQPLLWFSGGWAAFYFMAWQMITFDLKLAKRTDPISSE